jgi:plant G-box-binding factor
VKLKDPAAPKPAEPSPDKAAASSTPRGAENFLSMIDGSSNTAGAAQHMEQGEPKLRQLLESQQPATDVAAVS